MIRVDWMGIGGTHVWMLVIMARNRIKAYISSNEGFHRQFTASSRSDVQDIKCALCSKCNDQDPNALIARL